jgi:REP element-mobilizing transposase RayT
MIGAMARPIRIEFPGAVYHVTARGNERRKTFRDDVDRRQFLATLEETIGLHDLRLHGFCLMPNHYHLIVETPLGNLSRAIVTDHFKMHHLGSNQSAPP